MALLNQVPVVSVLVEWVGWLLVLQSCDRLMMISSENNLEMRKRPALSYTTLDEPPLVSIPSMQKSVDAVEGSHSGECIWGKRLSFELIADEKGVYV